MAENGKKVLIEGETDPVERARELAREENRGPLVEAPKRNGESMYFEVDGQKYFAGSGKKVGRPEGSKNEQPELPSHKTPLAYMSDVMNDVKAKPDRRDRMAVSAAPYVHPKLSAVAFKDLDRPEMTRADIEQRLLEHGINPDEAFAEG